MGILGGNADPLVKCEQRGKQLLCEIKEGNRTAKVLGEVGSDGNFRPVKESGSIELTKKLKQYMMDNAEVKNADGF